MMPEEKSHRVISTILKHDRKVTAPLSLTPLLNKGVIELVEGAYLINFLPSTNGFIANVMGNRFSFMIHKANRNFSRSYVMQSLSKFIGNVQPIIHPSGKGSLMLQPLNLRSPNHPHG